MKEKAKGQNKTTPQVWRQRNPQMLDIQAATAATNPGGNSCKETHPCHQESQLHPNPHPPSSQRTKKMDTPPALSYRDAVITRTSTQPHNPSAISNRQGQASGQGERAHEALPNESWKQGTQLPEEGNALQKEGADSLEKGKKRAQKKSRTCFG